MSEESAGEKTLEPTEKKKADAAKKGDVLRSREVATLAAISTGGMTLMLVAPMLSDGLTKVAYAGFRFDRAQLDGFEPTELFSHAASALLPPIFMIGIAVVSITVATQMLLGREGRFIPTNMKPKGSRLNPVSGLKRIFGIQGLIELGKSVLKLFLLGGIAWFWASGNIPTLLGLGRGALHAQLGFAMDAVVALGGMLLAGLLE